MTPASAAVNVRTVALDEWLVAFEEGVGTGWSTMPTKSAVAGAEWLYAHFLANWGVLWTGGKADPAMWREDVWQRPTPEQLHWRQPGDVASE